MRLLSNEAVIQEVVLNDSESPEPDASAYMLEGGEDSLLHLHTNTIITTLSVPSALTSSIRINNSNLAMLPPPVHSIWTSPTAAASRYDNDNNSRNKRDELMQNDYEEFLCNNNKTIVYDCSNDCFPSNHLIYASAIVQEEETRGDVPVQKSPQLPRLYSRNSKLSSLISSPCRQRTTYYDSKSFTEFRQGTNSAMTCNTIDTTTSPTDTLVEQGFEVDLIAGPRLLQQLITKQVIIPKRRVLLASGVKMVVPIFPTGQYKVCSAVRTNGFFQMTTVVSCRRMCVENNIEEDLILSSIVRRRSQQSSSSMNRSSSLTPTVANCLHICLALDKSYLRNGKFAQISIRIRDDDAMPPHSKYPIGSCVATSFGVGVLVGWRVEDDCHVVRSLWQCRGAGAASAYLQRESLKGVVEAAVGFRVVTSLGRGIVLAYVDAGKEFLSGRFFVAIDQHQSVCSGHDTVQVVGFDRSDILSCSAPRFLPIIEHIREAAKFQLQLEDYNATMQSMNPDQAAAENEEWGSLLAGGVEKAISCIFRAVDEDPNFDKEMNTIVANIIRFLEQNDAISTSCSEVIKSDMITIECSQEQHQIDSLPSFSINPVSVKSDFWLLDDLVGYLFGSNTKQGPNATVVDITQSHSMLMTEKVEILWPEALGEGDPNRAFGVIRTLIRAATIARVETESENVRMLMNSCIELLLFARTILKVRKQNATQSTLEKRVQVFHLAKMTFEPIKDRIFRLWGALTKRLEKKGKRAKARFSRLANILIRDDTFMAGIENREWSVCISQLESAVVKTRILDAPTCAQIHASARIVYNSLAPQNEKSKASCESDDLFALLARLVKWLATPWRAVLQLLKRDDVLEVFERILLRVFEHKDEACQMLNIYAYNFHSCRHLIVLKNMQITSKLWHHLLETAHAELAWIVSRMPDNQLRYFAQQACKIFGLGIIHFETLNSGDPGDWMDFLMGEKAVSIIQEIDQKIFSMIESFCNDVKVMIEVLPYYSSIDDDIANLVEELHLRSELIQAAEAIVDSDKLAAYLSQKAIVAIDRFFDYLPKVRIPVYKREIAEGWLLTCHAKDGGDLCLSNFNIKRELFSFHLRGHPSPKNRETSITSRELISPLNRDGAHRVEISILDDIRALIQNAQKFGCWIEGVGGKCKADCSYCDDKTLGVPLSQVLCTAIQLWRDLEIDDDELMELAIRDVSYQIEVNETKKLGKQVIVNLDNQDARTTQNGSTKAASLEQPTTNSESSPEKLNSPRIGSLKDPIILSFEMNKLSCKLDDFKFRVEPKTQFYTIFDIVFEGVGTISICDLSLKISLECRKERHYEPGKSEAAVPVLQLYELEVGLDDVSLEFRDTGIDWLLNPILKNLQENITEVVETTLQQQLESQIQEALIHVNTFVELNPNVLLKLLGVSMDDLEENVVWV